MVQGADADDTEADTIISEQYDEAKELLTQLAAEFVDADRSRIIVVPGNHDVHWERSKKSMTPVENCPPNIATEYLSSNSKFRWDWKHRQAYEVSDGEMYESRLEHFRKFQAEFYSGLEPNPLYQTKDIVFTDHSTLDLAIVGFASWYGNDCFCGEGQINSESISLSQQLIDASDASVRVAVWHHSVEGGPRATDYMDRRVVQRLIDCGFNVGMHGHQHYPGAIWSEIRVPDIASMAIVSAGSFAVGDDQLPMGESRQFNVVDINPENQTVLVHVRAMSPAGNFGRSYRDDLGGGSFFQLDLPDSISRPLRPSAIRIIDDALDAVKNSRYEDALTLILEEQGEHPEIARQIRIEALTELGRKCDLIAVLSPPLNPDELFTLISLFIELQRYDEADAILSENRFLVDPHLCEETRARIETQRLMS